MEPADPEWTVAVLVCCNARPPDHPRGSCGRDSGRALRRWLRDQARAEGLKPAVVVHESGCLDVCGNGTTVAVLGPSSRRVLVVGDADWAALWAEVRSTVTP